MLYTGDKSLLFKTDISLDEFVVHLVSAFRAVTFTKVSRPTANTLSGPTTPTLI